MNTNIYQKEVMLMRKASQNNIILLVTIFAACLLGACESMTDEDYALLNGIAKGLQASPYGGGGSTYRAPSYPSSQPTNTYSHSPSSYQPTYSTSSSPSSQQSETDESEEAAAEYDREIENVSNGDE
jgi:hypothetical protein